MCEFDPDHLCFSLQKQLSVGVADYFRAGQIGETIPILVRSSNGKDSRFSVGKMWVRIPHALQFIRGLNERKRNA